MQEAERRREARIRVAFQVLRALPPLEGVARLSDVSAQGALLEGTDARPAFGQAVQLAVRVPDRRTPLLLVATVVRHADEGFAVEFEKPSEEFARLLGEEPPALTPDPAPHEPAAARGPAPVRAGAQPTVEPRRAIVSPIQEIAVECCANTHWISGRICMPPRRSLLDQLNQDDAFLRMVDAVVPHLPDPLPFLALRSQGVDLVLPLIGQEAAVAETRVGSFVGREVRALLPWAIVDGTLDVLEKIRLSDHVMRCGTFLALRDCRIRLARGQRALRDLSRVPIALLNARRLLGIADLAASPPPEPTEPA